MRRTLTVTLVPYSMILKESGFSEFCVCNAARKACRGGQRGMAQEGARCNLHLNYVIVAHGGSGQSDLGSDTRHATGT
jgi:hypothetical protein